MSQGLDLLYRHLNGETLDAAEREQLSVWVCLSAENARLAAELTCLHQNIYANLRHQSRNTLIDIEQDCFSLLDTPADHAKKTPQTPISFREFCSVAGYLVAQALKARANAAAAIAAVLICAGLLYAYVLAPGGSPPTPSGLPTNPPAAIVATLTAERDAHWQAESGTLLPARGAKFHAGDTLTLSEGYVEITTAHGAVAVLEAPATIELLGDNALYLHRGRLLGICRTESSKGFAVYTDHGLVKDLGTEFGVDARPGQLITTVVTGKVEMTPNGGQTQPLTKNQTARLDTEGDAMTLVVEDQLAAGFNTLRTRPALNPIDRWQEHLAELDRSHGLIGQLSFDSDGVVATPGTGATFDANLVGGTVVPGDEARGTAAVLLANGHDHGVNLTLDPALEHEQLTLITWINISRAPGQDYTTLAHPTVENFLKNSFSWQINYNAPALVMDRYGPEPNFTEAPLPDDWPDGWHCLASVLDTQAGTAAHYLNGQPLGSSTLTDRDRYAFHELRIGGIDSKLPKAAQRYLNGSLGLFLALDQALPPDQIKQFYQASSGLFRPTD